MAYNEQTSRRMASLAAKILRDPKSSEDARSLAASVLTQAPDLPRNAMHVAAVFRKASTQNAMALARDELPVIDLI